MLSLLSGPQHFAGRVRNYARRRAARILLEWDLHQSSSRLRRIKSSLRPGQRLICIGLIEHFGDIIACEPVARYFREKNPDAYLVWLVRPQYRELVAFHPSLNETVLVSCLSEYTRLIRTDAADEFVDLHVNLRRCSKFGSIHHKRKGDPSIDASNYFAHGSLLEAFCKSAGLPALREAPQLPLPPAVRGEVVPLVPDGPFVVIHASSNDKLRDWQPDRWVELIASLSSSHPELTFVEVGLRPLIADRVPGMLNLCGRLTLVQLAEVIRRSALFLGVDSGPAHMANAFERPAVILLGRYRAFERYMPYTGFLREHASQMVVQWDGPAAHIPVEVVAARVGAILVLFPPAAAPLSAHLP